MTRPPRLGRLASRSCTAGPWSPYWSPYRSCFMRLMRFIRRPGRTCTDRVPAAQQPSDSSFLSQPGRQRSASQHFAPAPSSCPSGSSLPVQRTTRHPREEDPRDGWYCECLPRVDRRAYPSGVSNLEIREFLASRRAKISPERAGLPRYGSKRRVPGLRREEVALLADVSVEYYTRLERGGARGVSRGRRRVSEASVPMPPGLPTTPIPRLLHGPTRVLAHYSSDSRGHRRVHAVPPRDA